MAGTNANASPKHLTDRFLDAWNSADTGCFQPTHPILDAIKSRITGSTNSSGHSQTKGGLIDLTETIGAVMKKFLESDQFVKKLEFPCITHLARRNWFYRPSDYYTVAQCIGVGKVQVYEDAETDNAAYFNLSDGKTGDFFLLAPHVAQNIHQWMSSLVHEATHMIQDYKKMKLTLQEMETDTHFAQALYRAHLLGRVDKANSHALTYFDIAAQEYVKDPDYLKSMAFRKYRFKLLSSLIMGYGHKQNFTNRIRLDGVIL